MIDRIPVIDLNRFETGDPTETKQAAQQLDQACREIGFLVITNHGVEASVQQALYDAGHAFFDMELDHKMTIRRPRDDQNRGYIPYGEETLARMHGGDTPPDYKEVFAIGPYDRPDDDYHSQDRSYPNFAPNLWPSGPATLEPAMKRYFDDIDRLSRRMAGYFALALDLPVDWFADKLDKHASQLRLLHYPAPTGELEAGQLRCGAHTDLGMMTILRNEAAAGGLQVRPRGCDWIDAPAIDDTFVINIGDLLMIVAIGAAALHNVLVRNVPRDISIPQLLVIVQLFGLMFTTPLYIAETIYVRPVPFTGESVAALIWVGIAVTAVAVGLTNAAIRSLGPNKASISNYMRVLFTAALAILLLGETFEGFHLFGLVAVVGGVYLMTRGKTVPAK